ncbi:MAG: hypothetical protein CSA36_08905 [Draconibacterium sp.]|nr:MAG: hypothetical protein CSA36_08905 [Draconibacterium sp.]
MNTLKWLFCNVDTQYDFVSPQGKLYVKNAELLKPVWQKLTLLAKKHALRVLNTADYHFPDSQELSDTPDFITSFPPHCMANTKGAELIEETRPENPLVINWDKPFSADMATIANHRNFLIRKDAFDVFKGNPYTEKLIKILSPERVIVYGVTTNVCVNDAVVGLANRGIKVLVVKDAIKELPNIPLPFENWQKIGVELIHYKEIPRLLK